MTDGIVNRVEASGIVQLDTAAYTRVPALVGFDLADHLEGGFILREAPFREALRGLPRMDGTTVALFCSADAVVPEWAWMLAAVTLHDRGAQVHTGRPEAVRQALVLAAIDAADLEPLRGARVVIKGCADAGGSEALARWALRLAPVVASLMFGEPCSTVPILKAGRT
jgi:hypothetical protein